MGQPAAEAEGRIQYRVPIVAEQDRIVGRASIKVDGRKLAGPTSELIAIAPADPHKVVTRRAPGDPFQQVMVREAGPTGAPHFVLVVETSAAMTIADRGRQRSMLDAMFGELPPDAKVTMLSADWDVSPIVEEVGAAGWPEALAKIDAIPSAGGLHLERALREAAERARKTGAGAVLFVGLGQDGFAGDGVAAPLGLFRTTGVRFSVVVVGAGEVPSPLVRATAETGGEAIPLRAFDESLPFLADALRPRPDHPALDARGEGEWHVLRTVTGGAVWIGRALEAEIPADGETARADAGSPLAINLASLWDRARLEWHDRDAADEVAKVVTPVTFSAGARDRAGLPPLRPRCPPAGRHGARRSGEAPQGRGRKDGQEDLREQGGSVRPPGSEGQPRSASRAGVGPQRGDAGSPQAAGRLTASRRSSAVTRRWARTPAASSVA